MNNPYQAPQSHIIAPSNQLNIKDLMFSFEGRIPRRWYWAGIGIIYGVMLVLFVPAMLMESTALIVVAGIACIPLVYCGFAVGAKRWHDRNKSGWWNLIGLIPYVGGIWQLIECGCMRGTEGPNTYGPDRT